MSLKVTKIEDFAYKIDEERPASSSIKRITFNKEMEMSENMFQGLSNEQRIALEKFAKRDNLFLTGPAGTGKTYLIKKMYELASMNSSKKTAVCAMTGCAALLLECNAKTLHSWSGIKLAKGTKEEVVKSVLFNKFALKSWKSAQTIILDEVSMLSKKVFEIIEEIGRRVKHSDLPFGGMQVVFIGDFFQLPPIETHGQPDSGKFCFETPLWYATFKPENHIELKTIFRQQDPTYINILQEIRQGEISESSIEILSQHVNRKCEESNEKTPTKLFPNRVKADLTNSTMYSKINEHEIVYNIDVMTNCTVKLDNTKSFTKDEAVKVKNAKPKDLEMEAQYLTTNCPCQPLLRLKKGCLVMCTINLDMNAGICNGSQGVVIDFVFKDTVQTPVVRFSNGVIREINRHYWQSEDIPCVAVGQYPLVLAWALTIHKIQGTTLANAEIDIGNRIFEYGQSYVALSRVKSLDGLYLSEFNPERIGANPKVIDFYKKIQETAKKPQSVFTNTENATSETKDT